jgi:putative hydrolase of the HAD superfamily
VLILFDIDGTLVDHASAFRFATGALHVASGSETPVEQFLAKWSSVHQRHFDRFLCGELTYQEQARARVRDTVDPGLSDERADELFSAYLDRYECEWSLFPDVRGCLTRLAHHRLGVISNGLATQQRRKLERTGIASRFEHVLISEDCGWPKPDARIFRRACAALGEHTANSVYVGDIYDIDARGARDAGLSGVWLDRLGESGSGHAAPIIRSLAELPALIESLS